MLGVVSIGAIAVAAGLGVAAAETIGSHPPLRVTISKASAPNHNAITAIQRCQRLLTQSSGQEGPVASWSAGGPKLFVAPLLFERAGRILRLEKDLFHPPIENWFALQCGLEHLLRGTFPVEDPDGDGFNNREEWNAGATGPCDAESHPPYHSKLHLVERLERGRFLTFNVVSPGDYQIKLETSAQRPEVALGGVGKEFGDGRFKIVGFAEKEGAGELLVHDLRRNRELSLKHKIRTPWPDYGARFRFELDPDTKSFIVREGDTFSLSAEPRTRFELREVTEGAATIVQKGAEKGENMIAILRAKP